MSEEFYLETIAGKKFAFLGTIQKTIINHLSQLTSQFERRCVEKNKGKEACLLLFPTLSSIMHA
jgi:hypothetical protein